MAVELPARFDLLHVNDDGFFSSFLPKKESEDDILQAFLDAEMAEELQYQEAVMISLITCQMPRNLSSSATPSMSTIEAIPMPTAEPSIFHVKEKGESSLSYCELCLEREEKDQMTMIRNDSSSQTCCLECRKTIELSRKQCFCKEKIMSHGNGNGKPFTAVTCNKSSTEAKTDSFRPVRKEMANFNRAQDDDGPDAEWKSYKVMQQQENSELPSIADFEMLVGRGNRGHPSTSRDLKKINTGFVDCSLAGQRWNRQSSIVSTTPGKGSDAVQAVSKDIQPILTTTGDDCGFDFEVDAVEFDTDTSQESNKNCKIEESLFKFFKRLEKLTTEEITDPTRLWRCPACQGGSNAYQGILALLSHAKRKGKKLNLHQVLMVKLVKLKVNLEEKLFGKGSSDRSTGDGLSKWIGLKDEKNDRRIVWPPMLVIMNTIHNKDENNKWTGMGKQELLDWFSSYDAIEKAQHAYNSHGHCGMSMLIFEGSARGYLEAQRLDEQFADQGFGRKAWKRCSEYVLPSGERQLYGFMALKEEVDLFNQYSKGKLKLKYEMRSYEQMVANRFRQMGEDNHRLIWWELHAKLLEESNGRLTERLQKAMKEIDVLKKRIRLQHEENMEEMDFLEQFHKNQMKIALEERENKEERDHESPHEEAENVQERA